MNLVLPSYSFLNVYNMNIVECSNGTAWYLLVINCVYIYI